MTSPEEDRSPERALTWLATLLSSVLVVSIIGFFARPPSVTHFDARTEAVDPVAEVFVPPPQAPTPSAAPADAAPEAAAPAAAPAILDVVPVVEAVAPAVTPAMTGLASLRTFEAPSTRPTAAPTVFTPNATGSFPAPPYPRWARQQGMQGKLQLYVEVSASGGIAEVKVRETSGHPLLDQHVLDWVKANWTWASGARRLYLIPFVFELQ